MRYKVFLEDEKMPCLGFLSCMVESSNKFDAICKSEEIYPNLKAFCIVEVGADE